MNTKRIALILAIATLVLCLCSCGGVKIEYDQDSGSYTANGGKVYLRAPSAYEPVAYDSEKAYGSLTVGIGTFDLFAMTNAPVEGDWLTTADRDVLYAEGAALPALQNFGTDRVLICREGEKIHAIHTITDKNEIDALISLYLEGESIAYPARVAKESLRLRFASAENPHLYYRLTYLEYSSDVVVYGTDENGVETETNYGKYFLYDRDEDRCVPVGDVIHKYVE